MLHTIFCYIKYSPFIMFIMISTACSLTLIARGHYRRTHHGFPLVVLAALCTVFGAMEVACSSFILFYKFHWYYLIYGILSVSVGLLLGVTYDIFTQPFALCFTKDRDPNRTSMIIQFYLAIFAAACLFYVGLISLFNYIILFL